MNDMKRSYLMTGMLVCVFVLASCHIEPGKGNEPANPDTELPDWYYTGGQLGTSFLFTSNAFEQPTPSVENGQWMESFKAGEALFEKQFVSNATGTRSGLGPVYVRSSCMHCHPNYGHGKSVEEGVYNTTEIGNGTLLVIFDPVTENYKTWVAGMPQLHAVAPFKAPIDESKIRITWKTVSTCAASATRWRLPTARPLNCATPK